MSYGYDALGEVTEVAYPGGNEALYAYTDGAASKVGLQVGQTQATGVKDIPGGSEVAKFAGDLAAGAMALTPPTPCQQQ